MLFFSFLRISYPAITQIISENTNTEDHHLFAKLEEQHITKTLIIPPLNVNMHTVHNGSVGM